MLGNFQTKSKICVRFYFIDKVSDMSMWKHLLVSKKNFVIKHGILNSNSSEKGWLFYSGSKKSEQALPLHKGGEVLTMLNGVTKRVGVVLIQVFKVMAML